MKHELKFVEDKIKLSLITDSVIMHLENLRETTENRMNSIEHVCME